MPYPTDTFPSPPGFPIGHEDVPIGNDLYTVIASYIPDLVTDGNFLLDHEGNVELGATKSIYWDDILRIRLIGGEIKYTAIEIAIDLNAAAASIATLNITGDVTVGNDLTIENTIALTGTATCDYVERNTQTLTQADEPGDPADNNAIFWVSSGVGYGDAGDLCCKITEGGGTTSFTISDYSAL